MLRSSNLTTQMSFRFPVANPSSTKAMVQGFSCATTTRPTNARRPENLYQVLRIKQGASSIEIKTAYRNLAKRFHPDVATKESDSGNFIQIHSAYETLSDPMARERYDLSMNVDEKRFRYEVVSSSVGYTVGRRTRRWETDQCW